MITTLPARRSECKRGGEPQSHKDSADAVCDIVAEHPQFVTVQRKTIIFPDGYKHEFDVVVAEITNLVEIGDVGDDSKHNMGHKSQMINDGIAQAHVEEYLPHVKYVKINKDDAFYSSWVISKLAGLR